VGAALIVGITALLSASCAETKDLGSTVPHGRLPVDERNPMLLINDGFSDNWQGEYALLLANGGGVTLAGIIVNTGGNWNDIDANITGWRAMTNAARASGMRNVPDPITSIGPALSRPADGQFASTSPNRSEGAQLILETSLHLSLPYRPLVVVTGGRLTDVADAYLMDPTVVNRVVVVSSLGTVTASGAAMGPPNGEMDPWADAIVAGSFRFVQVSAFYDQLTDVPASQLHALPANDFGNWIASKQPNVWTIAKAADQVGVLAVAVRDFVAAVEMASVASNPDGGAGGGPDLLAGQGGPLWLVTQVASSEATSRFWQLVTDPATYGRR
jgi:hypothetical protein